MLLRTSRTVTLVLAVVALAAGTSVRQAVADPPATGSQFFQTPQKWHDMLAVGEETPLIGDFNGDGRDEVAVFIKDTKPEPGRGDVGVALSDGARLGALAQWHESLAVGGEIPLVGDFNGDRKDDVAVFTRDSRGGSEANNVLVALSDGGSFGAPAVWHRNFCRRGMTPAVGDVDGDGKDDILAFARSNYPAPEEADVYVALARDNKFGVARKWHEFFCVESEIPLVGDFNGDGRADIATCVVAATRAWNAGQIYVALSDPGNNRFGEGQVWCDRISTGNEIPEAADLNNDRKCDLVLFRREPLGTPQSAGDLLVSMSDGTRFGWPAKMMSAFCRGEEVPRVGDFNGDHKADVACFLRDTQPEPARGDVFVGLNTFTGGPVDPGVAQGVPAEPPSRWRLRLERLRVEKANEGTDEPYLITVGFRSRFRTPNSTRIWWSGDVVADWASLNEGQDEAIIAEQGQVDFDRVRFVTPERLRAGEHPEALGVFVAAIEHDSTSPSDVLAATQRAQLNTTDNLRQAVEGSSEAAFAGRDCQNRIGWANLTCGNVPDALFVDDDDFVGVAALVFVTVTPDCFSQLWPDAPSIAPNPWTAPRGYEPLRERRGESVFRNYNDGEGRYRVTWSLTPLR